jgi:hypothetical protein
MIKALLFSISLLFLWGCQKNFLVNTSTNPVQIGSLIYKITPYTKEVDKQIRIHELFASLDLSTTFILEIINIGSLPRPLHISKTLTLRDISGRQYHLIRDASNLINQSLLISDSMDYTGRQVNELDIETSSLLSSPILTENIEHVKTQLEDIKQRLYYLEKKEELKLDYQDRLNDIKKLLSTYMFSDQVVYSQGIAKGLIIFPPLSVENGKPVMVYLQTPDSQTITFSFKVSEAN